MGAKKVITRLLNLVYLGAAGFACYSLVTTPLLSINVKLDVDPANLLAMIPSDDSGGNTGEGAQTRSYTFERSIKREGDAEEEMDIMSMLTDPEIIDGAFDTIHINLPIELPSLVDFMKIEPEKQPLFAKNLVDTLVPTLKEQIKQPLADGLPVVMERVAKKMASGAIGGAVKDQIANALGGSGDADSAFNELPEGMIDDMVDNVWGALTNEKQPKAESYHTKTEAEAAAKVDEALPEGERTWSNGEIVKVAADGATEEETYYYTYNNPRKFTEITEEAAAGISFVSGTNEFSSLTNARNAANGADPIWGDDYKVKITGDTDKYYQFERLTLRTGGLTTTVDDVANAIQESMGTVFETLAASENQEVASQFEGVEVTPELVEEISGVMGEMLQSVGLADENGNITDMDQALAALLAGFTEGFGGGGTSEAAKLSAPVVSWDSDNKQYTWEFDESLVEGGVKYLVRVDRSDEKSFLTTEKSYDLATMESTYATQWDLNTGDHFFEVKVVPNDTTKYSESDFAVCDAKQTFNLTIDRSFNPRAIRAITRDGGSEPTGEEAPTLEETLDTLLDSVIQMIPMDEVAKLNLDEMVGVQNLTMYVWIAVVALCAFPWVLFALITLIRTLRPKKCWTKPWVVFFFAFLQLLFGAGITYGITFGWGFASGLLGSAVASTESIGALLTGLQAPSIKFLVLVPSIIYLAMIPFTIVYAIFAHGPRKEFKIFKKSKAFAKKIAKGKMTINDVKDIYVEETKKILEKKYKMAV